MSLNLLDEDKIGIILNRTNSSVAVFQLIKGWERNSRIFEGMIVLIEIKDTNQRVLARIDTIRPSNDLYEQGNLFSEARKDSVKLPINFAQSWVVVDAQILLNVSDFGSVTIPPSPGDFVYLINEDRAEELLFKSARNKTCINFGYLHGYTPSSNKKGIAIPLEIDKLPMHLGIFGVTGSGKSFDTGALIEKIISIQLKEQDGKIKGRFTYPSIIIDAHGDYLSYFRHAQQKNFGYSQDLNFNLSCFKHFVFPLIYNKKQRDGSDIRNMNRISVNFNLLNPREIAELIVLFYHGEYGEGELQISALTQTLKKLKNQYESDSRFNPNKDKFDFNKLFLDKDGLEKIKKFIVTKESERSEKGDEDYVFAASGTKGTIEKILEKFFSEVETMHKLISSDSPFKREEYIDEIIKNGYVIIIDFSTEGSASAEINVKQFIMSYLAAILFNRFRSYVVEGKKKYHLFFLIEEAQVFCPSSSYNISASLAKEKIRAIATQGRKFGLSLGIITQRPSFVDPIVLSMLNSFIIHRIAAADENVVKSIAGGLPESIVSKLTTLRTGNFIFTGQMNFLPFPIWGEVISKYDRKIPPDVGDVKPSEDLYSIQHSD